MKVSKHAKYIIYPCGSSFRHPNIDIVDGKCFYIARIDDINTRNKIIIGEVIYRIDPINRKSFTYERNKVFVRKNMIAYYVYNLQDVIDEYFDCFL